GVKLASKYSPLIAGIKREYWSRLGLPIHADDGWAGQGRDSQLAGGDLYLVDADTVLYYKFPHQQPLEAGVITRRDPAAYGEFFTALRTTLAGLVGGLSAEWQPLGKPAGQDKEAETLHPTPQEVEAAAELENDVTRTVLQDVISKNSVFFNKLAENRERASTERLVDRFDSLGMITRDYAVLCSKTGQQILRVASRAAIEDPSHKNFKCYICGKAINEETVDEIITASDFGKKILTDDYWLLVRVVEALRRMGLSSDDLRLHRDEGLVNLSATINQEAWLFVLATHRLTLGDAYLISAHVATEAVAHTVIVSNARVSNLMQSHLERSNPDTSFDVVDSLSGLDDRFDNILREQEKSSLKQCLESFAALTPIRVQDLILQKVAPDAGKFPEQLTEPRATPGLPTGPHLPARPAPEPVPGPGNGVRTPLPPVGQQAPPEEEAFYLEEVMPEGSEDAP
ncbi:MAG TPA: hypothetical protein VGO93_22085, partial [Candidatus Xenobia bacterium]